MSRPLGEPDACWHFHYSPGPTSPGTISVLLPSSPQTSAPRGHTPVVSECALTFHRRGSAPLSTEHLLHRDVAHTPCVYRRNHPCALEGWSPTGGAHFSAEKTDAQDLEDHSLGHVVEASGGDPALEPTGFPASTEGDPCAWPGGSRLSQPKSQVGVWSPLAVL